MGDGVQVSDRLRVRGIEGRSISPAPVKDFFKVGKEWNHLGSSEVKFGEDSNDIPTSTIQLSYAVTSIQGSAKV